MTEDSGAMFDVERISKSICFIETATGSGTGFCAELPDKKYVIVTNAHVLADEDSAKAATYQFSRIFADDADNHSRVNKMVPESFWKAPGPDIVGGKVGAWTVCSSSAER